VTARLRRAVALVAAFGLATAPGAHAQQDYYRPSANDYGGAGLLQTRTARFHPDGEIDVGAIFIEPYRRYYITFQFLPWLEGTFRYTDVRNRLYSEFEDFSGDQSFKDRGADLKFKILNEGEYVPALALGLQDGLGTGLFSGEYLVASKRWFDFDFSVGMRWGYGVSGSSIENPLINLSSEFARRGGASDQGGTATLENYFRGETVALFAGVEWATPIQGLSLKLEYDPNDYQDDPLGNQFERDAPFNIGLAYRPYEWLELSGSFERGNTAMFRFALRGNVKDKGLPKLDPPPPQVKLREPEVQQAAAPAPVPAFLDPGAPAPLRPRPAAAQQGDLLFETLGSHGLAVESVEIEGDAALVAVTGRADGAALDRAAAAAAAALPHGVVRVALLAEDGRVTVAGGDASPPPAPPSPQRVAASRPERIDDFFDVLEARGYQVEAIDLSRRRAVIQLAAAPGLDAARAQDAAWLVAETAPTPLDEVVVTAQQAGFVTAQASWTRPGLASASAGAGAPPAPEIAEADRRRIAKDVFDDLEKSGFIVDAFDLSPTGATVWATPTRFRQAARNIGRAARAVANHTPPSVEEITVVLLSGGLETARVALLRRDLERAVQFKGSPEEIWANATFSEPEPAIPPFISYPESAIENPKRYPSLSASVRPTFRQHIGGPESFLLYQVGISAGASVDLARGLSFAGELLFDVYNTFDEIRNVSDSQLPHVRSDIKEYLQQGENGVERLQADYLFQFAPNWFGRVSGGIFEEMFGGYSGEVLYRPYGSRFAVGVDVNRVRQREFDKRLEFRDYKVTTGHLNLYYKLPFYDLQAEIHAGQFLAGDRGAQFVISREFESGVRVGGWATVTNVSAEQFGEGSFDKGIFIGIPFDLFLLNSTRRGGAFAFRPLTRDGGQMVGVRNRLYGVVDGGNVDRLVDDWSTFLD